MASFYHFCEAKLDDNTLEVTTIDGTVTLTPDHLLGLISPIEGVWNSESAQYKISSFKVHEDDEWVFCDLIIVNTEINPVNILEVSLPLMKPPYLDLSFGAQALRL